MQAERHPDIPTPFIEILELDYSYPDGSRALNGVSFSLNPREKLALVGANGSGKSTLMLHLAGCLAAQKGEIRLEGTPIGAHLDKLRNSVGLIFQEPDDQLFMPSVLEDVAFGLISKGVPLKKAHAKALAILERFSIAHLAHRPPHRLSGGEKRMVALSGILVMNPNLIVLDEPSAALDPRARRRIIEILAHIEKPLILATHDLDMALDICDRALILCNGEISAMGPISDILTDEAYLRQNGLELPLRYTQSPSQP